jgi:tRNA uridine 5-carbamoylmethylation protein Kti12
MTVTKEICIMSLIGLPGAGKTTFCRAYAQHLARKGSAVKLVVVALDELIPLERQAAAVGDDQRTFKRWREQIAAAVDFHIERATKESSGLSDASSITQEAEFEASRADMDSSANSDVKPSSTVNVPNEESSLESNEFLDKISLDTETGKILVIVDDNNYLRSMRYLYHQVQYGTVPPHYLVFICLLYKHFLILLATATCLLTKYRLPLPYNRPYKIRLIFQNKRLINLL